MNAASAPKVTIEKWGQDVIDKGFQIVPDLLLKKQASLEISTPEMVVLLNVLMHWWTRSTIPFPSAQAIAERIGINRRSVDRSVDGLVKKGLLKKKREGNLVLYDPTPLAEKLQQMSYEAESQESD